METANKKWTDEDKAWAIGGGVIVIGGGIYWYLNNKKAAETVNTGTDTAYLDQTETTLSIGSGSSSSSPQDSSTGSSTPTAAVRQADTMRWAVGQEVMANVQSGTKTYEAKKMANGSYTSGGALKKTFPYGDKIGKIIWVGLLADGTYRYVIEEKTLGFISTLYWVADYRVIVPIDGSKGIAVTPPAITSSLNVSLLLKKGSKGAEVSELQKRLGITVDGDFGSKTLTALLAQKKVSQITLANFATTNPSNLNFNLILKNGSRGLEVVELQKRLGFSGSNADGIFGAKTESALFAMKGVKQTTLNQFSI